MGSKTGLEIDTVERFSGQYALISKRGKAQRRVDYHTLQADESWEMFVALAEDTDYQYKLKK